MSKDKDFINPDEYPDIPIGHLPEDDEDDDAEISEERWNEYFTSRLEDVVFN